MSAPEEVRTVFSAAHFIYIPLCVMVGIFLGWLLGARTAQAEIVRLRQLLEAEESSAAEERLAHLEKR
jgi:hypothetical protein